MLVVSTSLLLAVVLKVKVSVQKMGAAPFFKKGQLSKTRVIDRSITVVA